MWITEFLYRYLIDLQYESYFNRVGESAPFISFFFMQIYRVICLALLILLWCTAFYITVKKFLIYLNLWALTFTVFAFTYMFVSSGRQVVERKMKERGQQLSSDDKSKTWKAGVTLYGIAFPFAVTSFIVFFGLVREA